MTRSSAALSLLTAFALVMIPVDVRSAEVLRAAYEDDALFPFTIGEGGTIASPPGISVELVQAAAERAGVTLELERMPWKRGLVALERNHIDGLFSGSYRPDRERAGRYPRTASGALDHDRRCHTTTYALYTRAASVVEWDGAQIHPANVRIGAPLGFSIVGDLRATGIRVEPTTGTLALLRKLSSGRLDGVAAFEETADALLERHPEHGDVVKRTPLLAEKDYFLILSHAFVERAPELAERIWDAVAEVRDSPAFQARRGWYNDQAALEATSERERRQDDADAP